MTTLRAVGLLFVLLVSVSARADANDPDKTAAQEAKRFAELVAAGDRARLARRNSDAFRTYRQALDIRDDPAVEGRLGLVISEIGDHATAAEYLLRAITKAQASPSLMRQFHDAFARVRPKVCFVEVFVSEQKAQILIDGNQERDSGQNTFYVFVTAGSHTFKAKLDGFEDATETIDIPAGGEHKVRLELKPLPPPPPPPPPPAPPPVQVKPVVDKPTNRLSDSYAHFYAGAGGVVVLGAGPGVAVGPQISGGFRRGFFSLNADARVAWAVGTLESAPDVQFMTWAVGVRPCAHYAFLFGCGLLQADGLESLSDGKTRFGGGGRAGVEFALRKPIRLHVWAEAIIRSQGYEVIIDGRGLSIGSPVLGGFGATTFLTF